MTEKKGESLADNLFSSKKQTPVAPPNHSQPQNSLDFEALKTKLESFKKKILKKFPFTKALGILPPNFSALFEEDEGIPKEISSTRPLHLVMVIPEEEYKNLNKIKPDVIEISKESGENLWVHIKTSEVDVLNYGLDSKYEFIDAISASFPLYDTGYLGALRVASIHKNLVLNWLNVGRIRYVATYAIGGSLVRGTADKTSDVDTFVIIDDTDVKRMSRVELLEKLRGRIVYEFVKEATALAGVKNILNVQVYLLTDFWQSVKDAQPVMFTFIRDGIPLYDRGTFTPWKRLLQMGKIKPSPEAIDLYMKEGERTDEMIKRRMLDAMVDVYFGVVTPTQAMMMLSGHAPPVPKTIVAEVKKVLVDEKKVMTLAELKTLEKVVKHYKDYEHGKLKEISGKEIDLLLEDSKKYTKKIKEIREKLESKILDSQTEQIYDSTFSLLKKIFSEKKQELIIKEFEKQLIKTGKIPERMLSILKEISEIKSRKGKISQTDVHRINKDSYELVTALTEYLQRKDLISLERGIVQIDLKDGKAEIVQTEKGFFIIQQNGKLFKFVGAELKESSREEFEKSVSALSKMGNAEIPSELFEALKKKFGEFVIKF